MQRIPRVLAPVLTPFKKDLAPDEERFVAHCQWLLSRNCGLAVFGTTSEANSLGMDERLDLLDALVASGADPARLMPGTGCCSIADTVRLTTQAVKLGCAGVLMLPPFYYKSVTDEGLYRYFSEVVQQVGHGGLRIYLYHIPPVAVVGITVRLVERLRAAYPGVIAGMKDSSGDWNNTKMFLDAFAKTGFDLFVGSEVFLLQNLEHGGTGTISATANVNPAAIAQLCADWEKSAGLTGPGAELDRQQEKLNAVRAVFAKYPMIPGLKQAVADARKDPEWNRVRPPLTELSKGDASGLATDLAEIGFAAWKEMR